MLSLLISYAYMKPKMLDFVKATQGSVRWLLDCGAFTAHMRGVEIDLDEYIDFTTEHGHLFWQYVALDKVGNATGTQKNLDKMRASGLNPMPVLTIDEDVQVAQTITDDTCKHLCVAGGVSERIELFGPRLAEVRDAVGKDVWLHGLGFARGMRVASTHVDSVDASSWMSGFRWGNFTWFDQTAGIQNIGWKDALSKEWKDLPAGMRETMVGMGLTRADLTDPMVGRGSMTMLGLVSTYAYFRYAASLQQRGVRFIFPVGNTKDAACVLIAANHATEVGVPWKKARPDSQNYREIVKEPTKYAEQAAANVQRIWGLE
tara:strand:- start:3032 stop:3982 length:951 start_codon:yes stop_codon:yes gene_type:complete